MKVTIEIPDNCELVKDGEKYIVKEKKQFHQGLMEGERTDGHNC